MSITTASSITTLPLLSMTATASFGAGPVGGSARNGSTSRRQTTAQVSRCMAAAPQSKMNRRGTETQRIHREEQSNNLFLVVFLCAFSEPLGFNDGTPPVHRREEQGSQHRPGQARENVRDFAHAL